MSNDAPPVYRLASDQDRPATPPPAPTRPKGRRWVWGVLALVVVVAVPVVLVVGWFVRGTVKAGRGAEAPSVALLSWMYSFRDPDAVDADRYVIPERRAELSRQRAEFVAAARASGLVVTIEIGTPPAGQPAAENVDGDQAAVTDWYQAQWPLGRGALNHHTESLPWRADVRRSGDGWRIWSVQFPPWCGPGGCRPVWNRPGRVAQLLAHALAHRDGSAAKSARHAPLRSPRSVPVAALLPVGDDAARLTLCVTVRRLFGSGPWP